MPFYRATIGYLWKLYLRHLRYIVWSCMQVCGQLAALCCTKPSYAGCTSMEVWWSMPDIYLQIERFKRIQNTEIAITATKGKLLWNTWRVFYVWLYLLIFKLSLFFVLHHNMNISFWSSWHELFCWFVHLGKTI